MGTLREEMAEVWDKMEGGTDGATTDESVPSADAGPGPNSPPHAVAGSGPVESGEPDGAALNETSAEGDSGRPPGPRARDATGKFSKAAAKAPASPVKTQTPAPKPVATTTTAPPVEGQPSETQEPKPGESSVAVKPPASWRPAAREAFLKAPAEVQAEAVRREREIEQALNQTTDDRKFAKAAREVIAPFEGMIRAEGGEPLRAIQNLLQTAVALRTAPPGHKAQLVASLVRTYGIDIKALDDALAGQPVAEAAPQQFRDPRLDQLLASIQQSTQARAQNHRTAAGQELSAFSQKAEFYEDVREDMADLLDLAAKRNLKLSIEDAYNRAVAMHPEISGVLRQREAAKAAKAQAASTQRARAASSSIKTQPAGGNHAPKPAGTPRADVEAAWESLQQRM